MLEGVCVCACVDIMRVQSNVYCGDRIAEYNRVAARRVCVCVGVAQALCDIGESSLEGFRFWGGLAG